MITKLKFLIKNIRSLFHDLWVLSNSRFETERLRAEITRNTHSIEKGLSLENIRKGFGLKKIEETYMLIKRFININSTTYCDDENIKMFICALDSYLNYHIDINYKSDTIRRVEMIYKELIDIMGLIPNNSYGGILNISRKYYSTAEQNLMSDIIMNRHSIREFEHTPVNEENLKKSIKLALRCPSACNRQCHRVYIVDRKDFPKISNAFTGSGGFSDDLDKMLFITCKLSVYRLSESYQWVVTGSIFAAYLSITLEIYNIGCCIIQRPLLYDKNWSKLSRSLGIPDDEKIVCCIGIGNKKLNYKVPVSHRYNYDEIVKHINF